MVQVADLRNQHPLQMTQLHFVLEGTGRGFSAVNAGESVVCRRVVPVCHRHSGAPARWAIGATQVCGVDEEWPSVGSRLHHGMGRGQLVLRSETRVLASTPAELLKIRTEGWPTRGSELTITLEPAASGTNIRIDELAVAGHDHVLPPTVHTMLLQWRSTEALRGLALLAACPDS